MPKTPGTAASAAPLGGCELGVSGRTFLRWTGMTVVRDRRRRRRG
jgi:hypothetical protein